MSSSAALLAAIHPEIVMIQVGAGNHYGHPDEEVLQQSADVGAAMLRTDELGTIELTTDGRAWWWEAHESD